MGMGRILTLTGGDVDGIVMTSKTCQRMRVWMCQFSFEIMRLVIANWQTSHST